MISVMFSIYDQKAKMFNRPYFQMNRDIAIRNATALVRDPNMDMSKFPQDFILYELGSFDDNSGKFDLHVVPEVVVEFIKLPRE